jgi:UDP-N-acetylmuramoylalanine--D-glutamate ligase
MKVAIAGYGIEGESNYRYWAADPSNEITIVDHREPDRKAPAGVPVMIGSDAPEKLADFDLVIRTPRMAPSMIKTNGKIWSGTNEFFAKCPAKIIGVTGSKGKGTTASLITSMLEASGRKVWLVGNIGTSGLDVLNLITSNDIVVYELSSFQLWDIEKSPQIALVLYIEQEHLDVHSNMNEYVSAKANIAKYQTADDIIIYNGDNQYALEIADLSSAHKIKYPDNDTAHVKNDNFYYGEQKICSIDQLHIAGKFNQLNACAAIDAVWQFTQDTEAIRRGLNQFKGLPHRLQFVRELNGVLYYDDSIATIPGAAIAALKSFHGPKVMIMGGSYKGSDFSGLAEAMAHENVDVILMGDEAERMAKTFRAAGFNRYEIMGNPTMDKVVDRARQLSKPGGVVLLSPAAASFGLFKNYSDRGDQYTAAVNNLK